MDRLGQGRDEGVPGVPGALRAAGPAVLLTATDKTNDEVYYDMGQCLPEDMEYVIANTKLSEEFDIASTHMLLVDATLPSKQVRKHDQRDGAGGRREIRPRSGVRRRRRCTGGDICRIPSAAILKSDSWELLLINSEYKVASDEVNAQIDQLNAILKKYDPTGMLIGEAPVHEGHDRNDRPRLQGRQCRVDPRDLRHHRCSWRRASRCRSS